MKFNKAILPNAATLSNLLFGWLAILKAADNHLGDATLLIFGAAVFDYLDGKVARATQSFSKFGMEIDSLCDLVSFGVAPAALMYFGYFRSAGVAGMLISFLPALGGAIRLAKFNTSAVVGSKKGNFTGMPIPMSALLLSSWVAFNLNTFHELRFPKLAIGLIVLVSVLMVSTIEYDTFPKVSFKGDWWTKTKAALVFGMLPCLFIWKGSALFFFMTFLMMAGLVRAVVRRFRDDPEPTEVIESGIGE